MYTVYVRDIEFYGYHGVPAEERFVGHRYRVDLEMEVSGRADETDHIDDTVDYAAVAQLVTTLGQEQRAHTVERLARLIGEKILETFPQVQTVAVRLGKPLPPAPIIAGEAGVEIEITR